MYSRLVPTGHIGAISGSSSLITGPFESVGGKGQFDIGLYDNEPAGARGSVPSGGEAAERNTPPRPPRRG
ncbi:hypothetical protein GCM10010187_62870 [Actinomadura coerulea]|nr:hypothetical protein GCM10010187_62870 [Actinomadura coerulea]